MPAWKQSLVTPTTKPAAKRPFVRLALLLLCLSGSTIVFAQTYPLAIRYLPRVGPERTEGLAAELKTGGDTMILVSALASVKGSEAVKDWPPEFRLRFYLPPQQSAPDIRIRQLRSLTGYYMMDNVKPVKPWANGVVNEVSWARDIVAQVYDFQVPANQRDQITKAEWLAGLGVVVSLGKPGILSQTVAPAALTASGPPGEVSNYLFTFRTTAAAKVTGAIRTADDHEVLSGLAYQVASGSPFTVRWSPAANQADGWYRLTLDATLDGQPQIVVRFYHRRSLLG